MQPRLVRNNYAAILAVSAFAASIQPHIPRDLGDVIPRPGPKEKTEEDHRKILAAQMRREARAAKRKAQS